jgi:hypothetical protein
MGVAHILEIPVRRLQNGNRDSGCWQELDGAIKKKTGEREKNPSQWAATKE